LMHMSECFVSVMFFDQQAQLLPGNLQMPAQLPL